VQSDKVAQSILEFVRGSLPEQWPRIYADALPGGGEAACETIAAALSGEGHAELLSVSAQGVLTNPETNTRALIWLWKAAGSGQYSEALHGVDHVVLALNLLRATKALKRGSGSQEAGERKEWLCQVRSALSSKNYAFLRQIVKSADGYHAEQIRDAAQYSPGLSEHARDEIFYIIHETHEEHFEEVVDPWEEDAIYSTEQGLQKRREEHADLVDVQLAEAEKAIGRAASFGDLSENAEYTAAIEQRDRLAMKAGMMQQELSKAKRIDASTVNTERVTVGSRVQAKNLETNETETFTFLGPWDADIENGVYSYLAPLSRAFMGKNKGEVVSFSANDDERKWEILEIGSAV
jgi:transcription elongation GreA/GreB family factor